MTQAEVLNKYRISWETLRKLMRIYGLKSRSISEGMKFSLARKKTAEHDTAGNTICYLVSFSRSGWGGVGLI
jgi:hypothetical protein